MRVPPAVIIHIGVCSRLSWGSVTRAAQRESTQKWNGVICHKMIHCTVYVRALETVHKYIAGSHLWACQLAVELVCTSEMGVFVPIARTVRN